MTTTHRGGRRPGTTRTRAAILAAARRRFAEHGYTDTTIRGVAAEADVDPALVMHFFRTKDALFAAALRADPPIGDLLDALRDTDRDRLGVRLIEYYLGCWEDERTGPWMAAVTRAAASTAAASAVFVGFMTDAAMLPLALRAGGDDPALRANLAGAQVLGLGLVRYVLRVEPLASQDAATVAGMVGPVVQRYLTGPLPPVG